MSWSLPLCSYLVLKASAVRRATLMTPAQLRHTDFEHWCDSRRRTPGPIHLTLMPNSPTVWSVTLGSFLFYKMGMSRVFSPKRKGDMNAN